MAEGMADKAHRAFDAAREVVMRRILVVDDDLHTRLAIGIWLKQCGFRVAITDGCESGLAALNEGTFDLMIVDVFMPNMRGFESIRVFHGHALTVPLIRMAIGLGATRCLRKPFRPVTLLGVIDECLSEAEQRRKHAAALAVIGSAPPNISREKANAG